MRTFRIYFIAILFCVIANVNNHILAQYDYSIDGWSFRNFKTAELDCDVYRDTYIGISDCSPLNYNFDSVFYSDVYKDLADKGNCYGMSVMSLMIKKHGGFLGFCSPASQYSGAIWVSDENPGPSNEMLRRAINEVQGYQVSISAIEYMMSIFTLEGGKISDGNFAWDKVRSSTSQYDDPTIISITKTKDPRDDAHTMVAYAAVGDANGQKYIMVWDPDRTYAADSDDKRGWYDRGENYISIDSNGAWTFKKMHWDNTISNWPEDSSVGGYILATPISIAGKRDRNPSSKGAAFITEILNTYFLTGGDAQIEQVTDKSGRRLFKPGTFEIDTNPDTGMRTMIPWFPSGTTGMGHQHALVYFSIGSGSPLKLQIKPGVSGYVLKIGGARSNVVINSSARIVDIITIKNIGHDEPTVRIERLLPKSKVSIKATIIDEPGHRANVFDANNITVSDETAVEFHVLLNHTTIEAISYKAPMKYNLQLSSLTKSGATVIAQENLNIKAGQALWSGIKDWTKMNLSALFHQRKIIKQ